ncbi:MAG: hypothetical protein V1789_05900 [PVC group bacterium]
MEESQKGKLFVYALFGLFLILVVFSGLDGYYAALGSDPFGLVHFARHLAEGKFYSDFPVYNWFKGDWAPGESHFVLQGNYLVKNGRMYCKYEIGFPLFLAGVIRVFGDDAVYFANIFVLIVFLWFYFKLAEMIFTQRRHGIFLALLGSFLFIILIEKVWGLTIKPSRDLLALTALIAGLYWGVRALSRWPGVRWFSLVLGAFCLGYSGSTRLPNILVGVPAGLYLLVRLRGPARWSRRVAVVVLAGFFFVVGLVPIFLQNYTTEGHPLHPPRPEITQRAVLKVKDVESPAPLWIGFLATTGPDTLKFFGKLYGVSLTALIILGLISGWKSPEIKYLCLGIPLIFILFYSMWVHLMVRYMTIAQPFLILLAVAGVGKVLDPRARKWVLWSGPVLIGADVLLRLHLSQKYGLGVIDFFVLAFTVGLWLIAARESSGWKTPSRYLILACAVFALVLVKFGPGWFSTRCLFQLPQARQFGQAIDRLAPPGSVIFATKPVSQYISLFSGSHSIRVFDIERVGVELREGCRRMLDRSVPLFLFDAGGGRREGGKYIPILRRYFDVTPVGTLRGDDFCLADQFGQPVCTLYRIEPWNRKEVETVITDLKEGEDYLMTLNARTIWADYGDRSRVEVLLDGSRLDSALRDSINYIELPARLLHSPRSVFAIRSDQPLPRQMDFSIQSVWAPYTITFGDRALIPDYFLISGFERLHWQDGHYRRILWEKPAEILVPTVVIPDTSIIGQLDLRNGQKIPRPVGLRISLDGKEIADLDLSRVSGWEEVRFVVPDDAVSSVESRLELLAYPKDGYQVPYPDDDWWGALALKAVSMRRWLTRVLLETSVKEDCFAAFEIRSPPGAPGEGGPYRIFVDGGILKDNVKGGVQRLLLDPGQVQVPVTELRVESVAAGRPAFFRTRPVPARPGEDLVIDVGGEADWAFIEDGFYDPELFQGKELARWTAGTASLEVPLFSRRGEKIALSLEILAGPPASVPADSRKLSVSIDGRKLETFPLEEEGGTYRCSIPVSDRPSRLATLELTVPAWQPSHYYEITDSRELGVLLDKVRIEYH